jgi:hypothetical protein
MAANKKKILSTLALGVLIFAIANIGFAQELNSVVDSVGEGLAGADSSLIIPLPQRIALLINIVLGISGLIVFAFFVIGGFFWMTAGGNEGQVDRAKKMLQNSLIGLLIILSSYAISSVIVGGLTNNPDF